MNLEDLLTIVIPSKNEEPYIGATLKLLCGQHIGRTPIIIADASSTDGTRRIAQEFCSRLNIHIIEGGLPSVGRNAGARLANTKYILFMDSDCELRQQATISDSILKMEKEGLDLLSVRISSDAIGAKALYWMNNIVVQLSRFDKPFAVGTYMLVRSDVFNAIGGFSTDALHCEDYVLSRKFDRKKFDILKKTVFADNRRFKKMGYLRYIAYVLRNMWNRNDPDYFRQDVGYWK